jgi:hypothetical protein
MSKESYEQGISVRWMSFILQWSALPERKAKRNGRIKRPVWLSR